MIQDEIEKMIHKEKQEKYMPRIGQPATFYEWSEISLTNRENGHLTEKGEMLLQEYHIKKINEEVACTKAIEKDNIRLANLVNVLKKRFISLVKNNE